MSCCCSNTLDFCQAGTCEGAVLDLGVIAGATGVYVLKVDYLDTQFRIAKPFVVGDPLTFPTDALNENYEFVGKVLKPDGSTLIISKDGVDYDCISFFTQTTYQIV